jgi:FkbM family methyltransferase
MKIYSQNDEQVHIVNFFGDYVGNFLDIGANDGVTLSNTCELFRRGWGGVYVEPSEKCFKELLSIMLVHSNIHGYNVAIGKENGTFDFWESGEHLGKGDHGLLSSLKEGETKKWTKESFSKKQVEVWTVEKLLSESPIKTFDFVSIDIEGLDYDVMVQMDFDLMGTKMICVETNSKEDEKYIAFCEKFGFKVLHKTHENLIFAR